MQKHCRAMHTAPPRFPVIDSRWLRSWKEEHGVSFKEPTKKIKVSRGKMLARTRVTTLNAYIARYVFQQLYGKERAAMGLRPEPIMISCDQKGVHYNESESKICGTLDLIGDEPVELKTNHGQSRSRLSLMTMVSYNDPMEEPPIEMLFKLKTNRRLVGLALPDHVRMSLQHSPSGSYREEHVLRYLQRWLPDWSADREKRRDYRINFWTLIRRTKQTLLQPCVRSEASFVLCMAAERQAPCSGTTQTYITCSRKTFWIWKSKTSTDN